ALTPPGETGDLRPADANAGRWLSGPPRGPLAGDQALLDAALRAWRAHLPASPNGLGGRVEGEPRVYWIGGTPRDGRTAVVAQPMTGGGAALGLVDLVAGRVLTDAWSFSGPATVGFQFGPGDSDLLVLDAGAPLALSTAPVRAGDGTVSREYVPLPVVDGVALTSAPGAHATLMRVRVGTTGQAMLLPVSRADLGFDRQSKYREERRLPWQGTFSLARARPAPPFEPLLSERNLIDADLRISAGGTWTAALGLPDGRPAWVSEWQVDGDASRLFIVIGEGAARQVYDGGPVDPSAALPVRLRMPDGQGWFVANQGRRFAFRTTPDIEWIDAGQDAVLLPEYATEVRLTMPGGEPVVLPLDG
ncbi:MAG TPA: hypothetical protein VGD67_06920, partial [Pseudonocardiaceae bacterium]